MSVPNIFVENIFEYATRNKLRFASSRGELSLEQLWDAPLRSKDGFDLNAIAKSANKVLKDATEENFVGSERTPAVARLEMTLDVVKHIIDTKLADEVAAEKRAKNKQEKAYLMTILDEKQKGELSELSKKELQKRIAALDE